MTSIKASRELSAPVEDYLKVIFEVETSEGVAGTNEIAAALGVAPASVSGMIRRLAEQGWIAHERYRGVRLTRAGRRAALRTIRRHRIIESYLTTALGYPWDRVHDEAERLEHAASDELIDRMAAAIGDPLTDPHGAPIPTREGTLVEEPVISLAAVAVGERVRIQRVGDRDGEQLRPNLNQPTQDGLALFQLGADAAEAATGAAALREAEQVGRAHCAAVGAVVWLKRNRRGVAFRAAAEPDAADVSRGAALLTRRSRCHREHDRGLGGSGRCRTRAEARADGRCDHDRR
jgi:DtxR family Mn-dependent transcriptional regulator